MRILIVKLSSLGDIIHAFPVLSYLNQYYPHTKIDWVVEKPFAELVQAHPLVNKVLCVQTKKWRSELWKKTAWQEMAAFRGELQEYLYDIVIDLQGNMKSGLVTASAKSHLKVGFGYNSVSEWPNILATHKRYNPPQGHNVREEYLFLVQSIFENFSSVENDGVQLKLTIQQKDQLEKVLKSFQYVRGLKVLVCPGSNWPNKQLSKETLQNFLQSILQKLEAHFFFIWGNQAEKALVDELAACIPLQSSVIDKLSLPALQNLMAEMDLVLAMDSLPLHLAGTALVSSFSIFGASSAQKYRPLGIAHEAYQGICPYGNTFERRCPVLRTCKTGACMKQLEGQELFSHFWKWWNG